MRFHIPPSKVLAARRRSEVQVELLQINFRNLSIDIFGWHLFLRFSPPRPFDWDWPFVNVDLLWNINQFFMALLKRFFFYIAKYILWEVCSGFLVLHIIQFVCFLKLLIDQSLSYIFMRNEQFFLLDHLLKLMHINRRLPRRLLRRTRRRRLSRELLAQNFILT